MTEGDCEHVDVAIIGAGPGGLALALGLQTVAPHLEVKVFEKARELLPIGACITLPNNATEALEALADGVYERVRDAAVRLVAFRRYDASSGDLLSEAKMPSAGPKRPLIAIRWYDLQRVLLECVAPGTVELGRRFLSAHQDGPGSVRVTLEGGAPVAARVLVGCDGNASAVWEHLFPDEPLQYTGMAVWRTVIPKPADWFDVGTAVTWEGDRAILFTRSMDGFMSLSGLRPWPEERLAEFSRRQYYGEEAGTQGAQGRIDRFLEGFSQFPARVVNLVRQVDPASLLEHGIFARPVRSWGRGAVTLLGDAAHVMPPNLGQGTGMALEDAHALAAAIGEHGPTEAALRAYEAVRVPRIRHISDTVMEGSFDFYIKGDRAASPMAGASRPGVSSIQEFIVSARFPPLKGMTSEQAPQPGGEPRLPSTAAAALAGPLPGGALRGGARHKAAAWLQRARPAELGSRLVRRSGLRQSCRPRPLQQHRIVPRSMPSGRALARVYNLTQLCIL